jgi:hypothetical protein
MPELIKNISHAIPMKSWLVFAVLLGGASIRDVYAVGFEIALAESTGIGHPKTSVRATNERSGQRSFLRKSKSQVRLAYAKTALELCEGQFS